jgi:hypothetical protein
MEARVHPGPVHVGFVVDCDRFFPEYFDFSLSISFHWFSITWKNGGKIYFSSSSSQGCTISGASVASAAGPFSIKKKVESENLYHLNKQ